MSSPCGRVHALYSFPTLGVQEIWRGLCASGFICVSASGISLAVPRLSLKIITALIIGRIKALICRLHVIISRE